MLNSVITRRLVRKTGLELCRIVPFLLSMWFMAAYLSKHNLHSYFYRMDGGALRQRHRMYRDTSVQTWDDIQQLARARNLHRIFDKADEYCVGVLSIRRASAGDRRYLTSLMMSLVTRISWKMQDRVSIRIFNVNAIPEEHREAVELGRLFRVDTPDYSRLPPIPKPGEGADERAAVLAKENVDYLYAMQSLSHCRYAVLLEDDALASRRWFEQVLSLVADIPEGTPWLFMKLFMPMGCTGWEWTKRSVTMLLAISLAAAVVTSLLLGTLFRTRSRPSTDHTMLEEGLDNPSSGRATCSFIKPAFVGPMSLLVLLVYFIVLFHCIGRQHLLPWRRGAHLHRLNYSMVAVLFARPQLISYSAFVASYLYSTGGSQYRPKDMLPHLFASSGSSHKRLREMVAMPSVFQHTGVHSSLEFRGVGGEQPVGDLIVSSAFGDDDEPIVFKRAVIEE